MPTLCLNVSEPFRRDVFLKERGDAGMEVGAQVAERGGVAVGRRRILLLLDWVMIEMR